MSTEHEQRLVRPTGQQMPARDSDPRSIELLVEVQVESQALAAAITDTTRRGSFLNDVPRAPTNHGG
jgi:hypothetical protein